jgi:hypothetical protein
MVPINGLMLKFVRILFNIKEKDIFLKATVDAFLLLLNMPKVKSYRY